MVFLVYLSDSVTDIKIEITKERLTRKATSKESKAALKEQTDESGAQSQEEILRELKRMIRS